mgnify:CR=1 FL=1
MKVVSINDRDQKQEEQFWEERKASLLEVLDEMRERVENKELTALVACSLTEDGYPTLHVSGCDYTTGVGLYEIGKQLFVRYMEDWDGE